MRATAGITPPSYGCRVTTTSVNLRTRPCASASIAATVGSGTFFHYTGRKYTSTCGDKYTWVELMWNNAVRYMANGDPATGASYAAYCPTMQADPSPYPTSTKTFINSLAKGATAMMRASNVPASVTLAQAILESGWGTSTLATKGLNLFGIKGTGPCGSITLPTQEWSASQGKYVTVNAAFRKYCSLQQSMEDHAWFFLDNSRYQGAMAAARDAQEFANQIVAAGYATSPTYAQSLLDLMSQYQLQRFDLAYA